ncbi:helix-turn-helix domain-containing protein [Streptomyces wedmorensis]|uniref:helix-turn-helix domain-containing protein n=1 Tax=Streptomyces wedmorensis TaxID=43759 RepID=UPI003789A81C
MVTHNPSAATPRAGVIHANVAHTAHYTVVGNHLAQHEHLSLTAIGLAAHIQSLPAGSPIGIKRLADRFPEGEVRIASALRELESHGYLHRLRERLPSGRIVTRTISCNRPGAGGDLRAGQDQGQGAAPQVVQGEARRGTQGAVPRAVRGTIPYLAQGSVPSLAQDPADRTPAAAPFAAEDPAASVVPDAAAAPAVPFAADAPSVQPVRREADRLPEGPAAELLLDLRRHDPRMLLSARDVRYLAPAVDEWFARGVTPDAVRRTLLAELPDPLRHPAGILSHRLAHLLPPPLPTPAPAQGTRPIQLCVTCENVAFRAWEPGQCPDCRADAEADAAAVREAGDSVAA